MESSPLKIRRKKTSVLWEHATKVFHENGSVKHIKCIHCGKTFSYVGSSTSNALNHLYRNHSNHLNTFMDSKNIAPHTYELKCEMKQKLEDGIETAKTQKDYDDAGTLSKYSISSNNDESVQRHPILSRSEDIDDDNTNKDDSDVESGNDNSNDDISSNNDDESVSSQYEKNADENRKKTRSRI